MTIFAIIILVIACIRTLMLLADGMLPLYDTIVIVFILLFLGIIGG